jgi:transketolase
MTAKYESYKPTIIFIKTTIGYGSINSGCSSVHGAPLGKEKTQNLKELFGFDKNKSFYIDDDVYNYFKKIRHEKKIYYEQYDNINNISDNISYYLNNVLNQISNIKNGSKNFATRDISNVFLNTIIKHIPNMIVGSADLAESNKTMITSDIIKKNNFSGMYLHYGVREHSMMSIANGISTFGIIPVVSTFLVFITYALCSIRMAALSKHKVIYILTHDSIFLGEDGPTHQPVESLTILRSIPNLLTIRPCDVNEVGGAYASALQYDGPTALILSRQVLSNIEYSDAQSVNKGAYIVWNKDILESELNLIIIATGSEVSLAIEVAIMMKELDNMNIRVISMPCSNLFDKQDEIYKKKILPRSIKKMSLEAGSTLGWYKYAEFAYGIDTFGESAKITDLKDYFGFTKENIREFIKNKINE